MPFFKTTNNILKDHGEHFNDNWMDSNKLILPPTKPWDYSREIHIDDVDIWEVIHESNFGIYVAWCPYTEFYLLKPFYWMESEGYHIETFYGNNAAARLKKRADQLDIKLHLTEIWVDDDLLPKIW